MTVVMKVLKDFTERYDGIDRSYIAGQTISGGEAQFMFFMRGEQFLEHVSGGVYAGTLKKQDEIRKEVEKEIKKEFEEEAKESKNEIKENKKSFFKKVGRPKKVEVKEDDVQ